jgi:hypothetical protein
VAVGALVGSWFIEKDGFAVDHLRFLVTFVTKNVRVASRKREVRARVVIKSGRNPSLDVVALRTAGLPCLGELRSVRVGMAIFADLRRSFELRLVGARRLFVTGAAGDCAVCA